MIFINLLTKFKKRAISPVIAAVLLIGLVVMGSAVLMFMVLPLLNPAPEFEITSSYLFYDKDRTITYRHGVAELRFSLQQVGTAQVEISAVKLYYAETAAVQDGTEIELDDDNGDGARIISMAPSVTTTTTQEVTTTGTTFVMRFRLPNVSEDTPLDYKIEVQQATGQPESTSFGDEGMNLGADAPRVNFDLDQYIRTDVPLSASASDTHGGIANVTYSIYNDDTLAYIHNVTVDSQPWSWIWITRDPDYPNGNYTVGIIAKDYAGWNATWNGTVEVDNDYTPPTIESSLVISPYTNQTGERGEPIVIEANITDTGYQNFDATVAATYIHYELNKSDAEVQTRIPMSLVSGNVTWGTYRGTIPSAFVDHEAVLNNLTYYIEAIDSVSNTNTSADPDNGKIIGVFDLRSPDFTHTPVSTGYENSGVSIETVALDTNEAATNVWLYYRQSNDTILTAVPGAWQVMPLPEIDTENFIFFGIIPYSYATLDGIDYYLNATDRYLDTALDGNIALDGSPDYPHHITIPDTSNPAMSHTPRYSIVDEQDLSLTALVSDNDPTFWIDSSTQTGTVEILYKNQSLGGFISQPMTYIEAGDFWEGIIYGGNLTYPGYGLDYYIQVTDNAGNTVTSGSSTSYYHVEILASGIPFLEKTSDTVIRKTVTVEDTFDFIITNNGDQDGTITHLNVTVYNSTSPNIAFIKFNGTTRYNGASAVNTSIPLATSYDLPQGEIANFSLQFSDTIAMCMYEINYTISYTPGPTIKYDIIQVNLTDGGAAEVNYDLAFEGTSTSTPNGGPNENQLITFDVDNLGDTLTITEMRVEFTKTGVTIDEIDIPSGTTVWGGGGGVSGIWYTSNPSYTFVSGNTITILINFSGDAAANTLTITFKTSDGYEISIGSFYIA